MKIASLKRPVIAAGIAGCLAGISVLSLNVVDAAATAPGQQKIAFCHRTGAVNHPYVFLDTSANAIIKEGHQGHTGPIFPARGSDGKWGDIIPPFNFTGGSFPGLNWPAGASIVANHCSIPGTTTTTSTTRPHQTTTTQPVETTTTQPGETTTTQPQETTTTQPGETTTTLPSETTTTTAPGATTTLPGHIRTLLSLRARVIGGPATVADFELFATGPVDLAGISDTPGVTRALVPPGFYRLSDRADAFATNDPYTASGWDCVGSAETTPSSATLDAGEVAVCEIVFTFQAPTTATTVPVTGATVPPTGVTPVAATTPAQAAAAEAAESPAAEAAETPAAEAAESATPATSLATTGSESGQFAGIGALTLLAGAGLVVLTRRPKKVV